MPCAGASTRTSPFILTSLGHLIPRNGSNKATVVGTMSRNKFDELLKLRIVSKGSAL